MIQVSSALRAIPPPCLFCWLVFFIFLHFWIVFVMIVFIELSIELCRQQPGPGPAGSWAGPAWFKMLLGLGGNRGGGGGGERGNFMYFKYNFSFSRQKRILHLLIHPNFPIRVFWRRWNR